MTKRFTLADYISTLKIGKRNRQIYFSLYDNGNNKTKKPECLFSWQKYPFDKETNKIIAQNHDRYVTTIVNYNHTDYEWWKSDTCVKIFLSNKRRHYKNNLKIYQVFINNKKCFISTDKLETELWLQNHKELWLNPKQRHKAFGVIHRAQNNEFENMRIETIVLDEYDKVIQKDC